MSAYHSHTAESVQETWEAPLSFARQEEKLPPCQGNCPSGTDIRGWINIIAQRDKNGLSKADAFALAWRRLVEFTPLPSVVGRVCPHTCESECNRRDKEGALSIQCMERFIGDWALEAGLDLPILGTEGKGESIGVIGSGPAGLSFAYQMARRGYRVTIYEQHEEPGGMLRYGIPAYRLPRDILRGEIDRILRLGVELRLGVRVGREISAESLRSRHRALFLAIGADKPQRLNIPGDQGARVLAGTAFMYRINQGHSVDVGESVVVVGGGNTAIDAARAARRRGARVTMLYRRTRLEMPAIAEEIDDALNEGVHIEYLAAPLEIREGDGGLGTVVVQRMRLGEPDASGRAKPVPLPGETFDIPASLVIPAVSQEAEWGGLLGLLGEDSEGRPKAAPDGHLAGDMWSGGDALGLGTVTQAIGQGRRAAEALHAALRGQPAAARDGRRWTSASFLHVDHYAEKGRLAQAHRPVGEWLSEPDREIKLPIDETQFLAEASRCLSCGNCFGCQLCWMYCNASAFVPRKETSPGFHFELDPTRCEGCGKCIELCPAGYLSPRGGSE